MTASLIPNRLRRFRNLPDPPQVWRLITSRLTATLTVEPTSERASHRAIERGAVPDAQSARSTLA
jgi:hypothetical protein